MILFVKRNLSLILVLLCLSCGQLQVERKIDFKPAGPGNYQIADIYVDNNHFLYATGYYWTASSCISACFDNEGNLVWQRIFKKPDSMASSKGVFIIGGPKATYVLAQSTQRLTKNFTFVKYDSIGNIIWQKDLVQTVADRELALGWAHDYTANTYIAWSEMSKEDSTIIFITKYRPSGDIAWRQKYYSPDIVCRYLRFATKRFDQFVIVGNNKKTKGCFLLRYDSTGTFLGLSEFDHPEEQGIDISDIEIDNKGTIYLATTSWQEATRLNLTLAYDKDGNLLWTNRYDARDHLDDETKALWLDDESNLYVTGYSSDSAGVSRIVTIRYDPQGNEAWNRVFQAHGQSVKPYFFDHCIIAATTREILLLGYNKQGSLITKVSYRLNGQQLIPMACSGFSNIAVAGHKEKKINSYILKFGQSKGWAGQRWD